MDLQLSRTGPKLSGRVWTAPFPEPRTSQWGRTWFRMPADARRRRIRTSVSAGARPVYRQMNESIAEQEQIELVASENIVCRAVLDAPRSHGDHQDAGRIPWRALPCCVL